MAQQAQQAQQPTASIQDQLAAAMAEIERLKAEATKRNSSTLTFKVSEKGGLSVYGLQRFPVTLFVDQWERLFGVVDSMKEFAKSNAATLKRK